MSLPPGFLDELRTRISLSQVVGRKVVWDMRKSNQGKGDMWAPCPFHQEKSASFHADDRKGFYYCFGCQAKGDALTFIMETENLGFMEAVELLAREAGLPMPARDPQAAKKADRRSQLVEVMEEAVKYFRLQLKTAGGLTAREYLDRRGLDATAQDRWEIGWAPDARQGVFAALTAKGFAPDLIVDSGVCAASDDGRPPYDRFRGRIIFPIRDGRGRAISLGGRSLDPNARAKYLNGPETELFDKGRNLFNLGPAREAAGKGKPLIVAEGYMDVIALCEAGFTATVAPLGTAVTEDQLRLMWRVSPEPVIALDGDTAGLRAALRMICSKPKGQMRCRRCWRRRSPWSTCCGSAKPRAVCLTAPNARPPLIRPCAQHLCASRMVRSVAITARRSNACARICLASRAANPASKGNGRPVRAARASHGSQSRARWPRPNRRP
jgi:DNA primase